MSKEEQKTAGSPVKTAQKSEFEAFVKNFPFSSTAQEIGEFFEDCGDVTNVNVLRDRRGRSKGIAFVKFNDNNTLQKAIAKNGADLGGRPLVVEAAAPRDQRPPKEPREFREGGAPRREFREQREPREPREPREGGEFGSSVFIGNLSYDTTEESLRNLFKGLGEVKTVRVAKGHDGRPRGFAHIDFAEKDAAKEAVKKSGTELDGRQIRVDFSSGARAGGNGGSRGGFRGGRGRGFGGGRGTRGGFRGSRGGFRGGNREGGAPREGGYREGGAPREGGYREGGAPREGGYREGGARDGPRYEKR